MTDYQLLRFSIFYNKTHWHLLINEHVNLLLSKIAKLDSRALLVLYLSIKDGENVGFTWVLSSETAEQALAIIHQQTISFLKRYPSPITSSNDDIHSMFMNFPTNSIQYNLNLFPYNQLQNLPQDQLLTLSTKISELIVDLLSDELINNESIFSLSFYLHVLLLRSFYPTKEERLHCLDTLIATHNTEFGSFLGNDYILNDDGILDQIVNELNEDDMLEDWMKEWFILCECFSKLLEDDSQLIKQKPTFVQSISYLIIEQLSLNNKNQQVIFSYISKSLKLLML